MTWKVEGANGDWSCVSERLKCNCLLMIAVKISVRCHRLWPSLHHTLPIVCLIALLELDSRCIAVAYSG